ncbi:class I SAM-dependent methyltransferase [Acidobacteria bacterium AH-259-O06]|nr:class I SAM-dependent methyltransferase [Acidobacteria bacterium AH-259-O06]
MSGLRPHTILDVGCDEAFWTVELARRLGVPSDGVYGIEIDRRAAEQAKRRLKLFEIDLESTSFPLVDRSIKLVTINQVLEHLKNVFFCLAECERVLEVNGHLAIGIPNLSGLLNRFYLLFGRQPMCLEFPGAHLRGFGHRAFLTFLRSNPAFGLVTCIGSSLYPFPPPVLETGARLLPGWAAYTFYLLRKLEHRARSVWLDFAADYPTGQVQREVMGISRQCSKMQSLPNPRVRNN